MRRIFLVPVLVALLAAPAIAAPSGKLVTADGSVRVNGRPAAAGALVKEGDRLSVGRGSRAVVLLSTGAAFRLGPNSELRVSDLGARTHLTLKKGDILSAVKTGTKYHVTTPKVVAAVRGTVFYMQSTRVHPSLICICHGKVDVSAPGKAKRRVDTDHHKLYAVKPNARWIPLELSGHTDEEAGALVEMIK